MLFLTPSFRYPKGMSRGTTTILIAASGSGGHLLPALAIARALKREQSDLEIVFVGSGRPLERTIISEAGFQIVTINVIGFKDKKFWGKLRSIALLPKAFLQTRSLFDQLLPDLVIGVGGYVSFLPVLIARLRGIPTWIHEAEMKPGLANWLQGWYATRISTAFPDVRFPRPARLVYTGYQLREELKGLVFERGDIESDPRRILILGGSQGAEALDRLGQELATFFSERGLEIWHQCRSVNLRQLKDSYLQQSVRATVEDFIADMAAAYRWADIIISRSGAGAVTEIGVVNKPTIFVPYPSAQGQHQLHNAMVLVKAGKALLVEEGANFTAELKEKLLKLLNRSNYDAIVNTPYQPPASNAAEQIAKGCLSLVA